MTPLFGRSRMYGCRRGIPVKPNGDYMKVRLGRFVIVLGTVFLGALAPVAHARNIDLYDVSLAVVGGTSGDWQDLGANNPLTIAGVSTTMACCGDFSDGTTPGLGRFTYTVTGAGHYIVSLYLDYDVSTPFYNEYGTINNTGSA